MPQMTTSGKVVISCNKHDSSSTMSGLRLKVKHEFGTMSVKVTATSMNLKQFLVRQEVVKLYRDILKTVRKIEKEEDRLYMKNWVKADFQANKKITDDLEIKARISYGQQALRELKISMELAK